MLHKIVAAGIALAFFAYTGLFAETDETCVIKVFIHGTYGSALSLLNYGHVKKDDLAGTAYLALQRVLRQSEDEGSRRFMGPVGLLQVNAENVQAQDPMTCMIEALAQVHKGLFGDDEESLHYLFGWSGLLSQQERRREAIRLYNNLVTLRDAVKVRGKKPVLKLYCYSHGCNVGLNLALVDACLSGDARLLEAIDPEVRVGMQELLAGNACLGLSTILSHDQAEKLAHEYQRPLRRLEKIDQIMLLALPVQEETAPFVGDKLFGRVIQVYSENDGIVDADLVSSKKRSQTLLDRDLLKNASQVKVVRWMHNRLPELGDRPELRNKKEHSILEEFQASRIRRRMMGGANPDCIHLQDPTHQDFWCMLHRSKKKVFGGMPLLVFTPLLENLLTQDAAQTYFDFCLFDHDDSVQALLFACCDDAALQKISEQSLELEPLLAVQSKAKKLFDANKSTRNKKFSVPAVWERMQALLE